MVLSIGLVIFFTQCVTSVRSGQIAQREKQKQERGRGKRVSMDYLEPKSRFPMSPFANTRSRKPGKASIADAIEEMTPSGANRGSELASQTGVPGMLMRSTSERDLDRRKKEMVEKVAGGAKG